jgi:ribosome biogenesis protein BMS1
LEKEVIVTKGVAFVRDLQEEGALSVEDEQIAVFPGVYVPANPVDDKAKSVESKVGDFVEVQSDEESSEESNAEEEEEEAEMDEEEEIRKPSGEVKPGKYVRVEFSEIPHSFFEIFDSKRPVIIGGLFPDETLGDSVQQWVKIKRHRFYARKPKSNDPLVVTVGWRRYQVLPVYFNEERGGKLRFMKYMPDFLTCWASWYGPPASVNIGVTGFQHIKERLEAFRITATGVTVEKMGDGNIVKKLRVNGHPKEIFQKTAKIADMFTSDIEATQFVGGLVRTVSGIRGVIKKVEKNGVVRCTFEDTVKASDIVFLNTWVKVKLTELWTPVNSLLSHEWDLVRTTAEIRAERGIRPEYKEDSVYKEVERPEYAEQVLHVGKKLKERLPYALKKQFEKKEELKVHIVNEDEAEILNLVRKTSALYAKRREEQAKQEEKDKLEKKRIAEREEEVKMHKRTERKQEFFKRNPKWVHKK